MSDVRDLKLGIQRYPFARFVVSGLLYKVTNPQNGYSDDNMYMVAEIPRLYKVQYKPTPQ